jgi:hypothetical protein
MKKPLKLLASAVYQFLVRLAGSNFPPRTKCLIIIELLPLFRSGSGGFLGTPTRERVTNWMRGS